MEVHAHSHTARKNWTHYFWEFLMLFLAVTLGFFVENQREHYIEHRRARELAGSFYEEMRSDSANLNKMIENRKDKESHLRYLTKYFKDSSLSKLSASFYYRFTWGIFQTSYIVFEPKDGILQQLRNSGSLRYFRNIEIQKAVGDFSVALNNLRTRLERETFLFVEKNRDFLLDHYDFSWIMARAYDNDVLPTEALKKYEADQQTVTAVIRGLDKLDRVETANHLDYYRAVLSSTRLGQMIQYQKASNHLVQLLRKEYHLE
jgi:hypothetical protein